MKERHSSFRTFGGQWLAMAMALVMIFAILGLMMWYFFRVQQEAENPSLNAGLQPYYDGKGWRVEILSLRGTPPSIGRVEYRLTGPGGETLGSGNLTVAGPSGAANLTCADGDGDGLLGRGDTLYLPKSGGGGTASDGSVLALRHGGSEFASVTLRGM